MKIDPRTRFSGRARDYARFRPDYPSELVPLLVKEIGLRPDWTVADVGSGTGLSAEPFLAHGNRVFGVEPNADMRRAAREWLGREAGFRSVEGSAEDSQLESSTVDLVFAGQAFHWFDLQGARAEFGRILRSGGWVVLAWNSRRSRATPFMEAFETVIREHQTDYDRVRHDRIGPTTLGRFFEGGYIARVLPHEQVLDTESLKGRTRSISYLPAPGEPGHAELAHALEALVRKHGRDGTVRIVYDTEVYVGSSVSAR